MWIYLMLLQIISVLGSTNCLIDIVNPVQNSILAGQSIDYLLFVQTTHPVALYISHDGAKDQLLKKEISPTHAISEDQITEHVFSSSPHTGVTIQWNSNGFLPGAHSLAVKAGRTDTDQNSVLCHAVRNFHSIKVPIHGAWWEGYTRRDISYMQSLSSDFSNLLPSHPPILSFEPHKNFIGVPTSISSKMKTLVILFAGADSEELVDRMVRRFVTLPERFSVMLFLYDATDWSYFPWVANGQVVTIRVHNQMKWWYVKRFLSPAVVCGGEYDYILFLDSDMSLPKPSFDPLTFVETLSAYDVQLGQPSHLPDSQTTHSILYQLPGVVGMWTNFVESGPFVAVKTDAYACIYNLLQPDLVSGYGYDMVWSQCAPRGTAVIHNQAIKHENLPSASKHPNFNSHAVAEGLAFFNRVALNSIFPENYRNIREFSDHDREIHQSIEQQQQIDSGHSEL